MRKGNDHKEKKEGARLVLFMQWLLQYFLLLMMIALAAIYWGLVCIALVCMAPDCSAPNVLYVLALCCRGRTWLAPLSLWLSPLNVVSWASIVVDRWKASWRRWLANACASIRTTMEAVVEWRNRSKVGAHLVLFPGFSFRGWTDHPKRCQDFSRASFLSGHDLDTQLDPDSILTLVLLSFSFFSYGNKDRAHCSISMYAYIYRHYL